jgi:hypothetical protein
MKTWRPGGDDEFDTAIDGEWRKASREEPPPHVDAAILAAARTRRPWLTTWQPLAAAAAVAGLAFLLVQLLPSERELEQPIRMEAKRPAAAPSGQTGASDRATMQGTTEAAPAAPRIRGDESREQVRRVPEPAVDAPQVPAEAAASRSDAAAGPRQLSNESRAIGELAAGAPAQLPPWQKPTLAPSLHSQILRLDRCRRRNGRR